ncbi:MAG: HEPN-associated N-terminal domain-containing protein [Victivallales bacterium]
MGQAKNQMMEEEARGFSSIGNEKVCSACFYNKGIKNFVNSNATSSHCDFCDKTDNRNNIAMPIEEVTEFIVESLLIEYDDPGNELPYDSTEGGYQGDFQDLEDLLLCELQIVEDGNSPVFKKIFEAIWDHHPIWCKKDYFGMTDSEKGRYSWEKFKNLVLRRSRYMFLKAEPVKSDYYDHWEEVSDPLQILDSLAVYVKNLGLVKKMRIGDELYRVRLDSKDKCDTIDKIGTAPIILAKYPNRMSPAGIPMFYAANDVETAIYEIWNGKEDSVASIGKFKILKECLIIDLSNIPAIPSIFDEEARHLRETIKFINAFVIDFSKPIFKDGREHVDYVPTQVVTEFFRYVFKYEGESIQGICYPSSKNPGHKSYVFFWGHKDDKYTNPNLLSAWCDLNEVEDKMLKSSPAIIEKFNKIEEGFKRLSRIRGL